jgi:hypothetical protein
LILRLGAWYSEIMANTSHTISYANFRDSMIKRLTIKSFKDVALKLGPLNISIGANASRKSNFFDALRVLQGSAVDFLWRRARNSESVVCL